MVCMDDVFEWFNRLEGHRRIDFLCGVLPMCHPLELRYIGSYLEDLGKKDFFILREAELKWNSIQQLCRLVDLSDPYTRSKIITAFALLHSYNTECANQLFLILQNNMQNVSILQSLANLDAAAMQTLLLLTMAVNHPAFTLIQRQEIREMLDEVIKITGIDNHDKEECEPEVSPDVANLVSSPDSPSSKLAMSPSPQSCVRVVLTDINVTSSRRREEDKKLEFQIQAHWSNGITIDMRKTHAELLEFHNKLIHLFPDEAGAHRQDRQIPYLHSKRTDEIAQISTNVTKYMRQMLSVPLKILDSDHVRQFFCDPTFSSSTTSSRTHSSLDGASSQNGSVQKLNTSLESTNEKSNSDPDSNPEKNTDIELRRTTASTDVSLSRNSAEDPLRKSTDSMKEAMTNGKVVVEGPECLANGRSGSSSESSPRKVDGDTQTEEFLESPPEGEEEKYPDEVVDEDEVEGEETCDVTVVVPPISIPDSPSPPLMPPPLPCLPRMPPNNITLIDPMAGMSLRPVAMVATTYPQTVMAGCSETSTTNRYAYSSQTTGPSPHSSPLPSPLISPRVSGPSMGPPLSTITAGARPIMVGQGMALPLSHQPQYQQQPRFQPYDSPRFQQPPPLPGTEQQPRYDPSRYMGDRYMDNTGNRYPPQPESPRYDPRYNGGGSVYDSPRGGPYHQHPQQHQHHQRNESPRFRDNVGRSYQHHRSDSPRGSVSSSGGGSSGPYPYHYQHHHHGGGGSVGGGTGGHRSRHHSQDSQRSYHSNHPPETIGDWLKLLRLHKYSDQLSKYSVDELMSLSEEDLEREGLTKGARKKLLSQIDKCREESRLLNGDVAWQYGPLYPLSIVTVTKSNHRRYQSGGSSSVDSSASYSDCSSPSPSPLTLRKDSVTSDAEYDKDSEVSVSVRSSHPSPNQHNPPSTNQSAPDDPRPPIIDQSTHFKPLPVQSHYIDSPTSSPGPQLIYPLLPVPEQKFIIDRGHQHQQQQQQHHQNSQHYVEKPAHYHQHNSMPYNHQHHHHHPPSAGTPPSGCSQCGCNGDCTTAHPPPPLPYPVRFVTPVTQLGMFPPAFLAGGNGNGLVNPLFHQHIIPNGISPDLLYQTQNHFFLTASSQGQGGMNHPLLPPVMPGGVGGPFMPVPASSPGPHAGKLAKMTCYNCGQQGHKAADCKDATMEAMTHNGQFHLRYGRGDEDR